MYTGFQLFVLIISWFVNQGNFLKVPSIVMRITGDMDQTYFAQLPANKVTLEIWRSDSRRLVVTSDNPLESISIFEAPTLDVLEILPNSRLKHLSLRFCPLDGLVKSLYKLQALHLLTIESCRLNGTFNLAELLPLQNLSKLSFESNRITEIILKQEEATSNDTELISPLQVLNLCINRIEYFNLEVLRPFPNLKDLLLLQNNIVRMAGSVFLPALVTLQIKQNHLVELNLTGCNCSALMFVYASQNKLTRFPLLGDRLTDLQVLDLKNNQLTKFNVTELSKQQHLTTLTLSNNDLKSFSIEDEHEPKLELPLLSTLELNGNQIEILDLRGWQLPSLQVLTVNGNPLISLPDDLLDQFPKLNKLSCFCADINCEWIQRHMQYIRNGSFEMSVAWQGPKDVSNGYRCVTVPYVGCVRCPFKRNRSTTTTERVR